jgi:Protein of unknown function (DUF4236)
MSFFRFHRSVKLFLAVRWNIGKKSSSLSFGGKGFHDSKAPRASLTKIVVPDMSEDNSGVEVQMHDPTATVPPGDTDFLKGAAEGQSRPLHYPLSILVT